MSTLYDPLMTGLAVDETKLYAAKTIALKLFPIVLVNKPEGKYAQYDRKNLMQVPETSMADNDGRANESKSDRKLLTYDTESHALKETIDKDDLQFMEGPFKKEAARVVKNKTGQLWLAYERRVCAKVTSLANSTTPLAEEGVAKTNIWSNASDTKGGDPYVIIEEKINAMPIHPNRMVLPRSVFNVLKTHPRMIDKLASTEMKVLTKKALEQIFDIDKVEIADAESATGNEKADGSISPSLIWGKVVVLAYVNTKDDLKDFPCGGKTVVVRFKEANNQGMIVRSWSEKEVGLLGKNVTYQVGHKLNCLIQCEDLIHVIKDVI